MALTQPKHLRALPEDVFHYYSPVSMQPRGRTPDWAMQHEPVLRIGDRFKFYAGIS